MSARELVMGSILLLAVLGLLAGDALSAEHPSRRRSVRTPTTRPVWCDADGDGYGAGTPRRVGSADEAGPEWVTSWERPPTTC